MRRLLPALALLAACSSDAARPDAALQPDAPPLTNATSLACPAPGALPFRLASNGFQKANNAMLATDNPRVKDEASDTLGKPGLVASVYLADDQAPGATLTYRGAKARTTHTGGLFSKPLSGERVSLWSYDPVGAAWSSVGTAATGADGYYDVAGTFVAPPGQPVYAMLEADGSCAVHFDYVLPAGSKVVVADIDGTLTTDDNQILMQASDDAFVPAMITAANQLTKAWAMKGYTVVYLTARGHNLRAESRGWLHDLGFADGPVITANGGKSADVYKTLWLQRMKQSFGWDIVAAYGNADTDIAAYNNAGISKDVTFIVGPLSSTPGIQPIANMSYAEHIATYVAVQPVNP